MKYWYILQYGWTLKILSEKKASHKGPHIIWFPLYEMPGIGKLEIKIAVA